MATVKLGAKAAGSIVKLRENGALVDFIVANQGKPASGNYDDSCNGTWLVRKDIHSNRTWDSSNNDYANSDVHSWLNNTYLNLLDADIKAAVKRVKIPYRKGSGTSTSVTSGANGLSCKVFLLSMKEVGLSPSYAPSEGATLSYFSAGGNTARKANLNGSPAEWWSRSPNCYNGIYDYYACTVTSSGDSDGWRVTGSYGVRPAFILPSDLSVSDDGTVSVNTAPTVTSTSGASGTDLGEKNEPFAVHYTVADEDGDTLTVTEKIDDVTKKTRSSVTSGSEFDSEAASDAAAWQQILNGTHTLKIEVSDGKDTAAWTGTFEKAVHQAVITLDEPMAVEGDITVARLAVTGEIPEDAEYTVEVTNNGNDTSPVWQTCTAEVKSGGNIVFENHENTNGAAFNFRVTVKRGPSNQGGYITGISGAFQ